MDEPEYSLCQAFNNGRKSDEGALPLCEPQNDIAVAMELKPSISSSHLGSAIVQSLLSPVKVDVNSHSDLTPI